MVHIPKAPRTAAQTRPVQPSTVQAMTARSSADPPTRMAVCRALRTSWLRRIARSRRGGGILVTLAAKAQQLACQAGECFLCCDFLGDWAADVARSQPDARRKDAVHGALAETRRQPADETLADHMLDHAV